MTNMDISQNRQLVDLRERVEKLERTVEFLLTQLKLEYHDQPPIKPHDDLRALVQQGNTIEAIRLYRERTGVGLKEAKDFVESL